MTVSKLRYFLAKLWWFGLESLKDPSGLPLFLKGLLQGAHMAEWVKMLRYRAWLARMDIRTILDVGAHVGEFASAARVMFPQAMIYSFEPLPEAFRRLQKRMQSARWRGFPVALGERAGEIVLHESAYTASSSILPMSETHAREFPWTRVKGQVRVPMKRLDEMGLTLVPRVLLKIDVQGYELPVLRGAEGVLANIDVCLIEISFEPLYQGEARFDDVYTWMRERGFRYRGAWSQFVSLRDGRILQQDALFVREGSGL